MNNNRSAFTIIEVLLAMTILTSCVFIISNLQIRAFNKVTRERQNIERTFWVKRMLYKHFLKPPEDEKKIIEKMEEPPMTFTTYIEPLGKKSILHDFRDVIVMLKSDVVWKMESEVHELSMVSFVWQHKKEQEKR